MWQSARQQDLSNPISIIWRYFCIFGNNKAKSVITNIPTVFARSTAGILKWWWSVLSKTSDLFCQADLLHNSTFIDSWFWSAAKPKIFCDSFSFGRFLWVLPFVPIYVDEWGVNRLRYMNKVNTNQISPQLHRGPIWKFIFMQAVNQKLSISGWTDVYSRPLCFVYTNFCSRSQTERLAEALAGRI